MQRSRGGDGPSVTTDPDAPPFGQISSPPHLSNERWQASFYDPTSDAPAAAFQKMPPGGALDLFTGQRTGRGFASDDRFGQV